MKHVTIKWATLSIIQPVLGTIISHYNYDNRRNDKNKEKDFYDYFNDPHNFSISRFLFEQNIKKIAKELKNATIFEILCQKNRVNVRALDIDNKECLKFDINGGGSGYYKYLEKMKELTGLSSQPTFYLYFISGGLEQTRDGYGVSGIYLPSSEKIEQLETLIKIEFNFSFVFGNLSRQRIALLINEAHLRTAVAAILTESYAHNIGAHALEGLKTFLINQWNSVKKENESILCKRTQLLKEMAHFDHAILDIIRSHSQFQEFITYLQGKSGFWGAIAGGRKLFGGEIRNLYELIDDFAKNNLLCGTLGMSEKYKGIDFYITYVSQNGVRKYENVNLGYSRIDEDYRYRFNEERLMGNEADRKANYQERTKSTKDHNNSQNWENLKEELEKKEIFLPEGIIAQQAIYTIWENIIRNIKHCVEPSGNNYPCIPFHIEIKEEKNFYKITNWIDLDSKQPEKLKEKVDEMKRWKGILNGKNKPNMGGTSQNILCAGLVLGLDFIETQEKQINQKDVVEFELLESEGKKRIAYAFKIWKGAEKVQWEEIKNKKKDEIGPSGRFKIIVVKGETEKEEFLLNSSSIRHVVDKNDKKFGELYKKWVQDFILKKDIYPYGIAIWHGYWQSYIFSQTNWKKEYNITNDHNNNIPYFHFRHGEPQGKGIGIEVDFKSDGIMRRFPAGSDKSPDSISEFVEIVATKIDIYDNRLYKLYSDMEDKKLLEGLGVNVYEEKDLSNDHRKHFLIIHLGFLEYLTQERNEEAVKKFFKENNNFCANYDFIIVTTGRGRNWIEGLNECIRKKIRFIPIENLERCFDTAKYLEPKSPAFGLKYALVKTIFGS
jgi:hypothetical protein